MQHPIGKDLYYLNISQVQSITHTNLNINILQIFFYICVNYEAFKIDYTYINSIGRFEAIPQLNAGCIQEHGVARSALHHNCVVRTEVAMQRKRSIQLYEGPARRR